MWDRLEASRLEAIRVAPRAYGRTSMTDRPVRVGLMGFGRIGRNLFRILYKHDDIQIVAISRHRGPQGPGVPPQV